MKKIKTLITVTIIWITGATTYGANCNPNQIKMHSQNLATASANLENAVTNFPAYTKLKRPLNHLRRNADGLSTSVPGSNCKKLELTFVQHIQPLFSDLRNDYHQTQKQNPAPQLRKFWEPVQNAFQSLHALAVLPPPPPPVPVPLKAAFLNVTLSEIFATLPPPLNTMSIQTMLVMTEGWLFLNSAAKRWGTNHGYIDCAFQETDGVNSAVLLCFPEGSRYMVNFETLNAEIGNIAPKAVQAVNGLLLRSAASRYCRKIDSPFGGKYAAGRLTEWDSAGNVIEVDCISAQGTVLGVPLMTLQAHNPSGDFAHTNTWNTSSKSLVADNVTSRYCRSIGGYVGGILIEADFGPAYTSAIVCY